jgi:thiamine-phosphate pyrophosphorylase
LSTIDPRALRGLYAITPAALCADPERLLSATAAALRGGARLIQYRDKSASPAERRQRAAALQGLCAAQGALLIINDDWALAQAVGAAGVHIGQSDDAPEQARAALGPQAVIGVTCGNSLERAEAARAAGASYVAFGRLFDSRSKPEAPPAELATLARARAQLGLPVCGIGGITAALAPQVIAAGADLVAAIDGVFGAADIEAAARAYARCFGAPVPTQP